MGASAAGDPRWQAISTYAVGPDDAPLTFAARLARENRWSLDHAERVIGEYRRFCYLACIAGQEVTPSDAVDQAWHLHLTYTRDYWERFCPEVLGMALHHGPTRGTGADRTRYYEQYAATLKLYEVTFGQVPPEDVWPSAARRFNIDPRGVRVNPVDVMIVPRGCLPAGFVLAGFALAAALVVGGIVVGG